jgi:3-oxoacyl-[acyl-carrier-protein] synthase II
MAEDIKKRVAVTGIGIVSAFGLGRDEFWEGVSTGRCAIGEVSLFDTAAYRTHIGAQVGEFYPQVHFMPKQLARMSRCDQLGVIAAREALEDSGMTPYKDKDNTRFGVLLGAGAGGMFSGERYRRDLHEKKRNPRPSDLIPFSPNVTTDYVANDSRLKGPRSTVVTACSSSSTAIGYAADWIRDGRADVVLAGGSDAMCELTYSGFNSLRAVDANPCRPFDMERKGLSLGEGAAILVLEDMDRAIARGVRIYAEIAGYGIGCDAYHMTAPEINGAGAARTILAALRDAGVRPEEIDYINAHGTATRYNDVAETAAIKSALGGHAYDIPISSIKSMIGHCLGAAGGLEAAATALTIYNGLIPPTIGYENPDPDCDLDYTPNEPRKADVSVALSNSLAFGGNNTTVVIRKVAV